MTDSNVAQSEMFISRREVLKIEARNRLLIQKIREYMAENKQLKQKLTESEATIQRMTEESAKYTPMAPDTSSVRLPDIEFLNTETESFFTNNF
jgi:predicted RNase H-like nuclease (RuvC/YqgF family)